MPNTVLSWKKQQKLGRFDPDAATPEEMLKEQIEKDETEIKERGNKYGHSSHLSCPDNRSPKALMELFLFKCLTNE